MVVVVDSSRNPTVRFRYLLLSATDQPTDQPTGGSNREIEQAEVTSVYRLIFSWVFLLLCCSCNVLTVFSFLCYSGVFLFSSSSLLVLLLLCCSHRLLVCVPFVCSSRVFLVLYYSHSFFFLCSSDRLLVFVTLDPFRAAVPLRGQTS